MNMTRTLLVVVVVLLALSTYQCGQIRNLASSLAAEKASVELRAKQLALDSLKNKRADLAGAGMWLHQYYRSQDGLQRPQGLWMGDHPDFDGIAAWLLDVYLNERIAGASDEQARQRVVEAIRQTDEWRRKHPGS